MMVLRHLGPPSTTTTVTTTNHQDISPDDDRVPMDLSNKHHSSVPAEITRHLNRNQFLSILPRPISSPRTPPSHNYILNNNNNNNIHNNNNNNNNTTTNELKCNSPHSSINSEESSPRGKGDVWRLRRKDLSKSRWRSDGRTEDDVNSHSSPDSGLHRDSPGEDEDLLLTSSSSHSAAAATTPPLVRKQAQQHLIPLSIIRARYPHPSEGCGGGGSLPPDEENSLLPVRQDKVLTKRARLEEMVTHIKSSKDRSRRNSGDDDTSSGGHATSSDEIVEDGGMMRSYNNNNNNNRLVSKGSGNCLNLQSSRNKIPLTTSSPRDDDDMMMDDEPCNLVCSESRSRTTTTTTMKGEEEEEEDLQFDGWKSNNPSPPKPPSCDSLSPTEAAKLLGLDPDTYQQQMMQLQLTSAAMLGDPTGMLKGMGNYPPWVYLGYYSQILQSFQAQEILRQYAIQSNNPLTPNVSQGEKSPSVSRNLGSSGYNCQSPLSPASLSEGPAGVDSDGSTAGQRSTPGSANNNSNSNNNGKRAPRAMTGRHVRTGTGASPATLQTLRQKIEERQRIKTQQARNELLNQPNSKTKHSKFIKKSCSKK